MATCKKMKLNHQLTPYTRKNLTWIKDLNINRDTIKVLEENIGSKISDTSRHDIFANISPRAREIKEKLNKWDYIKLKCFCRAKEIVIKMKREPQYYVGGNADWCIHYGIQYGISSKN